MKKILEFNCPEENEEYRLHERGPRAFIALERIGNELFRPARKHGYPEGAISEFLEKNEGNRDNLEELIGILEQEFYNILKEEDCNE